MANFPCKSNQPFWRCVYNSVWGARGSVVRKCQLQLLATELSVHRASAAEMHWIGKGSITDYPAGHHRNISVFPKHEWSAWNVLLKHTEGQGQLPGSSISFSCPGGQHIPAGQAQVALGYGILSCQGALWITFHTLLECFCQLSCCSEYFRGVEWMSPQPEPQGSFLIWARLLTGPSLLAESNRNFKQHSTLKNSVKQNETKETSKNFCESKFHNFWIFFSFTRQW